MKASIKKHLSITKKEWNGLVILVILIALVLAAPYVYQLLHKDSTINIKDVDKAVALLNKAGYGENYEDSVVDADKKTDHPVMFPFDPNKLNAEQWVQLGLSKHQAAIILHYQAKGGRFYTRDDVKKIYGVSAADYQRLAPFIDIPETAHFSKKIATSEVIELNTADSARLTSVRGIGPSFAVRIIRYRGRLGGFNNKEQLMEIYGIDSLFYAGIKNQVSVNPLKVTQININTISFNQLRIFPYLGYKQVNAIIQYRTQHGNYRSMADLKNVAILDDEILRKIGPYINFE